MIDGKLESGIASMVGWLVAVMRASEMRNSDERKRGSLRWPTMVAI